MEERIYTVREVADVWKLSVKTIRRLFQNDPDVIRVQGLGILEGTAKRVHVTIRIPESALNRVRKQLTNPVAKPVVFGRTPRRIRRLHAKRP